MDYLHKTRELFIAKFPKLAPFLAHNSNDPDIERIIENLAILTSKIRQELDQNIPHIAESLINIIAPNYTNSIPSLCIQEFSMKDACKENKVFIKKNSKIKSIPMGQIQCEFKTIYDVYLYPLAISNVFFGNEQHFSSFNIDLNITKSDTCTADIAFDKIIMYLGDDIYTSTTLMLWISQYLEKVILVSHDTNEEFVLPSHHIKPVGLGPDENLLDNNDLGFSSFALLQELFLIPEKFNFISIEGLEILRTVKTTSFGIKFVFSQDLPKDCLPKKQLFSLSATPIVNLFLKQAEPLLNDHSKDGYRIFIDRSHIEFYTIVQILKVKAHNSNAGRRVLKNYNSFERFEFLHNNGDFYAISNKVDSHGEHYKEVSFYSKNQETETISIDTLCCNNNIPTRLKIGDINELVGFADIATSNIKIPTPAKHIQVNGDTLWSLVSMLSFSHQTMLDKETFLGVFHTYGFTLGDDANTLISTLSEALQDIKSQPIYRINKHITQRGILCIMLIDESKFYCLGEVYRIGSVLASFFSSFASINSFCELKIQCIKSNIALEYNPISGNKALI